MPLAPALATREASRKLRISPYFLTVVTAVALLLLDTGSDEAALTVAVALIVPLTCGKTVTFTTAELPELSQPTLHTATSEYAVQFAETDFCEPPPGTGTRLECRSPYPGRD